MMEAFLARVRGVPDEDETGSDASSGASDLPESFDWTTAAPPLFRAGGGAAGRVLLGGCRAAEKPRDAGLYPLSIDHPDMDRAVEFGCGDERERARWARAIRAAVERHIVDCAAGLRSSIAAAREDDLDVEKLEDDDGLGGDDELDEPPSLLGWLRAPAAPPDDAAGLVAWVRAAAPPRPPGDGGGPLATVAALAARLRGAPEDDRVVVAAPDRVVLAGAVLERLDLNGEWTPRTARVLAHATSDGADVGPALQLFDARDETLRVATLFLDGCEIIMAGDADAADDEGLAAFKVAHPSGDVELAAGSVARRLALISEPRSWFFDIVARLKGDDAGAGAGGDDDDEGSVLFTEPDDDGRYRRDAFEATLPTVPEDEDEAPAPAIAAQPFPGVTVTTREGRLHVKLKRRFRKWKERHFRLSTRTMDNGRDAGPCLSMFVKSKNTFKLIPLAGTTAAASDEKPAKKRFGFVVAAPGDGAFRYEFYAATAADRDGWVADANAAPPRAGDHDAARPRPSPSTTTTTTRASPRAT
ncbi:phytanoyl-CoA dioxygenase [Aureococcus anophagefferens]|nr:phytanoyl-CoA dioxygenase [Aureococcus anophagefferens]